MNRLANVMLQIPLELEQRIQDIERKEVFLMNSKKNLVDVIFVPFYLNLARLATHFKKIIS